MGCRHTAHDDRNCQQGVERQAKPEAPAEDSMQPVVPIDRDAGGNGRGGVQIQASKRAGSGSSMTVNGVPVSAPAFQTAMQECRSKLPNGGRPSAAQVAAQKSTALKFSACMRSHGEPNFPDPQFGSGGRVSLKIGRGAGLDPRLPQFQAAQKACQKNFPGKTGAPSGALGSKTSTGGG